MKLFRRFSGLIALCLLCSGCWPMRFTASPGATGMVLDAHSHVPIAGAEVFVSRARYTLPLVTNSVTGEIEAVGCTVDQLVPPSLSAAVTNARPPIVITGSDGRFSIPPLKRWGIYVVPMDVFAPKGTLVVRREGYTNAIRYLFAPSSVADVGEIRLEKSK
jgi:hypothetical protein